MYETLGYSVYRRVREYYGSIGPGGRDEEDAFGMFYRSCTTLSAWLILSDTDMRKPLSRDPDKRSIRANGRDILVSAHDVS